MRPTNIADKIIRALLYCALPLLTLASCQRSGKSDAPGAATQAAATFDLEDVEKAGELIAVTLSGPETYYTYRGQEMGLQYLMAERFTQSLGLGLRMEIAHDTTELLNMLSGAKADLIACPLPKTLVEKHGLIPVATQQGGHKAWAVRTTSPRLASTLITWWNPSLPDAITKQIETAKADMTPAMPNIRTAYLPQAKGRISPYDELFRTHGAKSGIDWRLLAAMAWQESAFNPTARSWAGARGLMQIMPATGARLGLTTAQLNEPDASIRGASAYLKQLYGEFSDINTPAERIKFAIAAYNAGPGHVRDAMRLAEKHKMSPQAWDRVAPFVLKLSDARYYRDPVVKNGYMIGRETHDYVYAVLRHWQHFGGIAPGTGISASTDLHSTPERATRKNRFTRNNSGLSPNDSVFQIE